ncbi:MAG: hypothetical protein MUD01_06095 [Chloroflexaceae bacterium]|jgi:hypothetical protein|nr:hypothetical protein [Chloroflexaceae bacterium]
MTYIETEPDYTTTTASTLLALLEQQHTTLPTGHEELLKHREHRRQLEQQQRLCDRTLEEWRVALAHRWECEVLGQRLYLHIQTELRDYLGENAAYLQLVAPTPHSDAVGLLADLRRTEASLLLMQPRPAFVAERLAQLAAACHDLDEALSWTSRAEADRRAALHAMRLLEQAHQRLCEQTRRLLNEYAGARSPLVFS